MATNAPTGRKWRKILDSGIVGTVSRSDIRTAIKAVQAERATASGQFAARDGKTGKVVSKRG